MISPLIAQRTKYLTNLKDPLIQDELVVSAASDFPFSMHIKPFRTPFMNQQCNTDITSGPPLKKRRISDDVEVRASKYPPRLVFKVPGISSIPRKPFSPNSNPPVPLNLGHPVERTVNHEFYGGLDCRYNVVWYVSLRRSFCFLIER